MKLLGGTCKGRSAEPVPTAQPATNPKGLILFIVFFAF